ncbi:hypothetical protein EON65_46125 [archaeon]|nr:MAG: hypothetical protein EON65_46125 [archaeon]
MDGLLCVFCLFVVAKLNVNKTASRRKQRKAHFSATSVERRVRMSSGLSKELFQRHHVSGFGCFTRIASYI